MGQDRKNLVGSRASTAFKFEGRKLSVCYNRMWRTILISFYRDPNIDAMSFINYDWQIRQVKEETGRDLIQEMERIPV